MNINYPYHYLNIPLPYRDKVYGEWMISHNKDTQNVYIQPITNTVRCHEGLLKAIELQRTQKYLGKRPSEEQRRWREDNITSSLLLSTLHFYRLVQKCQLLNEFYFCCHTWAQMQRSHTTVLPQHLYFSTYLSNTVYTATRHQTVLTNCLPSQQERDA